MPTSNGLSYWIWSLPRSEWPTGAFRVSARAITSSWAPATPMPAKIATFLAEFRACAMRSTVSSEGTTALGAGTANGRASTATSESARSPGSVTTETPGLVTANWIAELTTAGHCCGVLTSSEYTEHSVKIRSGWVSWKYSEPMYCEGMWEAMASTGAPERLASYSPLIRCRLPGPHEPAHTASLPVSWASALAANAPASSWRTCTQSIPPLAEPPVRRTASTMGLRLSPTTP